MQQEISPKALAAVIGVVVVILLVVGYRVVTAHVTAPAANHPVPKAYQRLMHPLGPDNPPMR